jgi:hypothetical protein
MEISTETAIWLALRARVESLVLSPVLQIAWPDEAFQPVAGMPYLEVTHLPNVVQRQFLKGSDPHYFQGILQIILHAPLNSPHAYTQALEVAGRIAAHFPADQRMPYGNILVRVSKHPDIVKGNPSDTFWGIPITIQYHLMSRMTVAVDLLPGLGYWDDSEVWNDNIDWADAQ